MAITHETASSDIVPHRRDRTDLLLIATLLVLGMAVRAWVISQTEVAARDSIGFIRYALAFEHKPWQQVLRENHQHPGYPLSILAMSWPIRALCGGTTPEAMQLSAQLVTGVSGALLVIPMYLLGRFLFNRRVGFWSALLFQVLPVSGQLMSDGVSEGLFLLLCTTAMLLAVLAVEGSRPWLFAACGLCSGLAYCTRPEGAVVVFATAIVLLAKQMVPGRRRTWRQLFLCEAALLAGALVTGGVHTLTIGGFSNKPAVNGIMGGAATAAVSSDGHPGTTTPRRASAFIWADSWNSRTRPLLRSLWAVVREFCQALHYFCVAPLLLGVCWQWNRLRRIPGVWVLTAICLVYLAVLCRLGVKTGYVSDRHVMVLVLLGTYLTVAGLLELPGRLLARLQAARAWEKAPLLARRARRYPGVIALAALLVVTGICLSETLQPLHGNRVGHHAAGTWLAEHVRPGDIVDDDHFWAHYYAGLVFEEGNPPPHGWKCQHFVVISRSPHRDKALVRNEAERRLRAQGASLVYRWPADGPEERAHVVVYLLRDRK